MELIAIATATGNIGQRLAELLLAQGHSVRLLVRHPEKLSNALRERADVRTGSTTDERFVASATAGVDALFWATPNNYQTNDLRGHNQASGAAVQRAVDKNGIAHVVNVSSAGAHLTGAGPLSFLRDVEVALDRSQATVVHLRPGSFMENYRQQLESIARLGAIMMPLPKELLVHTIATADVADAAADAMTNTRWRRRTTRGLHGPVALGGEDAAAILSEALRRPIRYVEVTTEQTRDAMMARGATRHVADLYAELYSLGARGGFAAAEPRTAETTTPTTLAQFAKNVLRPELERAEGRT
jgi:uncharacterized protein YbjT (DUF2867 family)